MNRNYEVQWEALKQGETLNEITATMWGTCWMKTAKRLAKMIEYKKNWSEKMIRPKEEMINRSCDVQKWWGEIKKNNVLVVEGS
jgi:hypothetical protein